ncbi:inositol 1,4,5-triphosphate receptor type 1 [Paragonimus westermani]|uniref:Inositol 1,4,5-triphosphate receptor type 1 n=1 Tax=Paragonimus westermani TaxID=34504 RepID=A0A5J4P0D6_9TREM|nr:inositol 1,4,5-triphosphate receptor type 1 [Paragonimus westermani]
MLRHLGLHLALLQLLNAPFHITNEQTDEILHLTKKLIFLFCEGNEINQQILLQHVEQFLTQKPEDVLVLTPIVAHILQLPSGLQSKIIRHMVRSIQQHGPRFCWLRPLAIILSSHKTPLQTLQDMVLSELFSLGECMFSDLLNPAVVTESMEQCDVTTVPTFDDVVQSAGDIMKPWELTHAHLQLMEILSLGSAGNNTFVQLQCQTWFPLSNVVEVLTSQIQRSNMLCHPLHQIYLTYVENVFFNVEDGNNRIWTPGSPIWILWIHVAEEFEKFLADQNNQFQPRIGAINDMLRCLKSFFQTSTGQSSSVIKVNSEYLGQINCYAFVIFCLFSVYFLPFSQWRLASLSSLRVVLENVSQPKSTLNQNGPPLKRCVQALKHFQFSRSSFLQKRQSNIVGATSVLKTVSKPRESIVKCAITPQTHNAIAVDSSAQKSSHLDTEIPPFIEKYLQFIAEGITLKLKPIVEAKHALLVSAVCALSIQPVPDSPSDQAIFGPDAFLTAIIRHAHQLIDTGGDSRLVDLLEMLQHVVRTGPVHEPLETLGPKRVHFITSSTLAEPTTERTCPHSKTHRALCELIVRCVTASENDERVFIKSVELANRLLQDGNQQIQNTIYDILTGEQRNAQFFHAIFRRLHHTQTQMSADNGLLRTESSTSTKTQKLTVTDCTSNKFQDNLPPKWTELLLSTRPLLYFLHHLCASHHAGFQDLLRCQPNHLTSYNLIEETQLILASLTGAVSSTSNACQIKPLETGKKIVLRSDNPIAGRPGRRHTVGVVNFGTSLNQLLDLENNSVSTTTDCSSSPKAYQATTSHNPTTQKAGRVWSSSPFSTNPSILEFVLLLLSCLTEFCRGPCSANQDLLLVSPNSYVLEVIVKLATENLSQLSRNMPPKLMNVSAKLKLQAAKLLLALVEGRHDDLVAQQLLSHLPSVYLLTTVRRHYECALRGHLANNTVRTTIEEVGHCLYILAQQLSPHCSLLRAVSVESTPSERESKNQQDFQNTIQQRDAIVRALRFYQQKTAQIEIVGKEDVIEKLSFPIPSTCRYLSSEYQSRMIASCTLDERSSKFPALFEQLEDVFAELSCKHTLFELTVWFLQYPIPLWPLLPSFCLASVCFVNCVPIYVTVGLGSLCVLVYAGAEQAILILGSINVVLRITNLYVLFDECRVKNRCRHSSLTIFRHPQLGQSNVHRFDHLVKSERERKCASNTSKEIGNFIPSSAVRSDSCENFVRKIRKCFATHQSAWLSWLHTFPRQLSGRIYLHFGFTLITLLGVIVHPFFHSVVLLDVVNREETLLNVIRSVTKNGQSILLTAILALVIIYLYALLGYVYFKDDFVFEVEPLLFPAEQSQLCQHDMNDSSNIYDAQINPLCSRTIPYDSEGLIEARRERHCDSLRMCILTTLHEGLRNGGGIADVLRRPSIQEADFLFRTVYDLSFFLIVIIIVLNLVFGVIVDTFATLRQEKQDKEELSRNNCCVCGK